MVGKANITIEVAILWEGGLRDAKKEAIIYKTNPMDIVMCAHAAMELASHKPPHIVHGRWSMLTPESHNFVYTFAGDIHFGMIAPFANQLTHPLSRAASHQPADGPQCRSAR